MSAACEFHTTKGSVLATLPDIGMPIVRQRKEVGLELINRNLRQTLEARQDKIGNALACLHATRALFDKFGSAELKSTLARFSELESGLKSSAVRLVVVGEFSRGKSMLVNALLGIKLLRSAREATTAINTFVASLPPDRPEPYIRITFRNPGQPPLELDWADDSVLEKWGTELDKSNGEARRDVERIDIFTRHELLNLGLVLVDTPGLEALAAHHEEITRAAIAQSHIAIWVQSAEALGGNAQEWKFMSHTLRQNFRKFLTVINMWDQVLEPSDEQDRKLPEHVRIREKLDIVRRNFRSQVQDMTAQDLEILVSDENLMGVSAKWALDPDSKKQEKSGVKALADRIARMCNSGEAQQEILYKPVKQLAAIQNALEASLLDMQRALGDEFGLQEHRRKLDLFDQEIKNQDLEQRNLTAEAREEHYRVAHSMVRDIQNSLVQPLKELRQDINHHLTREYIQRQINGGKKSVGLPNNLQEEFDHVTSTVSKEWLKQKQLIESRLADLRGTYAKSMEKRLGTLYETIAELRIQLPPLDVSMDLDLSPIEEHHAQMLSYRRDKEELEDQIAGLEEEAEKYPENATRLQQAQDALRRAKQNLESLGPTPKPERYQKREKTSDAGLYSSAKYESVDHVDDSNVRDWKRERDELRAIHADRENVLQDIINEEYEKSGRRMTAAAAAKKLQSKIARLESELRRAEENAQKKKQEIVDEILFSLTRSTTGQLTRQINFLEEEAGEAVQKLFVDQLSLLLQCVEEQFLEPLRAAREQREEVLAFIASGRAEVSARQTQISDALTELHAVRASTETLLQASH
jgi:GTPase SAR1 family protein